MSEHHDAYFLEDCERLMTDFIPKVEELQQIGERRIGSREEAVQVHSSLQVCIEAIASRLQMLGRLIGDSHERGPPTLRIVGTLSEGQSAARA